MRTGSHERAQHRVTAHAGCAHEQVNALSAGMWLAEEYAPLVRTAANVFQQRRWELFSDINVLQDLLKYAVISA